MWKKFEATYIEASEAGQQPEVFECEVCGADVTLHPSGQYWYDAVAEKVRCMEHAPQSDNKPRDQFNMRMSPKTWEMLDKIMAREEWTASQAIREAIKLMYMRSAH